jgi:hypothetical protein
MIIYLNLIIHKLIKNNSIMKTRISISIIFTVLLLGIFESCKKR